MTYIVLAISILGYLLVIFESPFKINKTITSKLFQYMSKHSRYISGA